MDKFILYSLEVAPHKIFTYYKWKTDKFYSGKVWQTSSYQENKHHQQWDKSKSCHMIGCNEKNLASLLACSCQRLTIESNLEEIITQIKGHSSK